MFILPTVKVSKFTFESIVLLFLIILTSIISSFYYGFTAFEFLKGVLYFTKPILMILVGYAFCMKINNYNFIFKFIIYFSLLLALIHIFIVVKWFYFKDVSVSTLRYVGGKSNLIEFFGLVFLLSREKLKLYFLSNNLVRFGVLMLAISFIFYFSRTQLVAVIIFIFCIYGYTKLSSKSLIIGFWVIVSIITFFIILNSISLNRNSEGVEKFFYKLKVAPTEIFKSDINIKNHAELWDRWRGYEAKKAIEQVNEKGAFAIFFGSGIGSLVDLEIDYSIPGIDKKQIPIIHNGYIFVYFKAGLLGVFLYLLFITKLYMKTYSKSVNNKRLEVINNLICGFAFYLFFTTLIITGIYNVNSIIPFILGFFLGLNHLIKLNKHEDWNIRNQGRA